MAVELSFLKKLTIPKFSLGLLIHKNSQIVGIDIGVYSAKVVQLKYEKERAILETYGELLSEGYFKNVSTASGVVKYELLPEFDYTTSEGDIWDRVSFTKISSAAGKGSVQGVVLVQMLDGRKIKFEAFHGKTSSEVSGFTQNAKIYER